jgi:hypothetical protein
MLYECNWFKLQFLKYGPLIMGFFLLYSVISALFDHPDLWIGSLPVVVMAILLIIIFFLVKDKLKFVAIGKTNLIVRTKGLEKTYNWLDVEEITLKPTLGIYKLKMKDEASIYFTAYGTVSWLTGDLSDMGVIISKMKSELDI